MPVMKSKATKMDQIELRIRNLTNHSRSIGIRSVASAASETWFSLKLALRLAVGVLKISSFFAAHFFIRALIVSEGPIAVEYAWSVLEF